MYTHPVDPSPAQMSLRSASDERTQGNADDACHAEDGHRKTSVFVASPYICEGVGMLFRQDPGHMRAHIPVIVPPTILMLTELAPPPKKRVTINVAKFGAVAEGMSQIWPSKIG